MTHVKAKFSLSAIRELLQNTKRLAQLVWNEKKGLLIVLLTTFILVSAGPFLQSAARALLINELVESFGVGEIGRYLILVTGLLIAATILPAVFIIIQTYCDRKFWFFLQEKLEAMFLQKRGEIDVADYEDPKKNDLFQRVNEDGIWRIYNFSDRQLYIFQNIFEVIVATVILFAAGWWFLFIIILSAVPQLVLEIRHGQRVWGIFHARAEVKRRFWDLRSHFEQLPKLIELKLFQNLTYFGQTIKELLSSFYRDELRNDRRRLWGEFMALGIGQAGIAIVTIWLILGAVKGQLQIGTLTFFLASIGSLRQSLSGFFLNLGRQYQDGLFVTNVFKFLDLSPVIAKPAMGIRLDLHTTPEINFEGVTFAYPGTNKIILRNFSLKISPGEKIALVGVNGAGKTTLVKLLCRFYDPVEGRISVGGHDLKDIDLKDWYAMLGVLFQDYAQYHLIVKEAIAIGQTGSLSSLEKVKAAAQASEADVFIEEWEKNYEQMLGKEFSGGLEPSIGQWQKLALARTFYRDPRLLILDEPTSSIDAESEAKIFEKLEHLPKDRTVILISHRFSTVRRADRICVIDDGLIKELGSHDELLALEGTYARLFKIQAQGYK